MIPKENLTRELIIQLKERLHGTIFAAASKFGVWFDDAEIKYIETKMMTHKLYRLVSGRAVGINCRNPDLADCQRQWLLSFVDDPKIPDGVKKFIDCYIADEMAAIWVYDEKTGKNVYGESIARQFFVQRALEICR